MSSQTDTRGTRRWVRRTLATVIAVMASAIATGSADARPTSSRHRTAPTSSLARLAAASSGQSGAMLGGFTSQGWPGFFQLSPNGRMLVIGAIGVDMSCQPSGGQFSIADEWARIPIASGGKLHASAAGPPRVLSDGSTVRVSDSMNGVLNRAHTRLSGTWQVQATFAQPGQPVDHCSSGTVRFTATR